MQIPIPFEWHAAKAASNLRRQKVSFDEAATVFADPLSITVSDPDHSAVEMRLIQVGMSYRRRLIVVSYAERGDRIRIISARRPSAAEQEQYEEAQ